MTQSSCERDAKSKSHPGMKLAPVRVFSFKHPLTTTARTVSRSIRTATVKKCTKKCFARPENLLFCQSKPIAFLPLSLPSPSLKLPNDWYPLRELNVAIKGS